MTLICSNIVLIRFLGGVSLTMRLKVSFLSVTTKLVGGILVGSYQIPSVWFVLAYYVQRCPFVLQKFPLVPTVWENQ